MGMHRPPHRSGEEPREPFYRAIERLAWQRLVSVLPIPLLCHAQIVILHVGILFRRSDGVVLRRTSSCADASISNSSAPASSSTAFHSLTSAAVHGTHGIVASALTHGIVAGALGAQKEERYSVRLRGRAAGCLVKTCLMPLKIQHKLY